MRISCAQILILAALGGSAGPAWAQSPAPERAQTLFMGADVSVGPGKELYAVKDVIGTSWVIDVNGRTEVLSSKEGPMNIRVSPTLKLTEVSASIQNLKRERGYTFGNDPNVRLTRALTQTAVENADYHASQNQAEAEQTGTMTATQMRVNLNDSNGGSSNSPAKRAPVIQQTIQSGDQTLAVSTNEVGSDQSVGRNNPLTAGFDAVDVNFDVSSAKKLENPYVITMTRFHPRDSGPGTVQILVYARSLNPIDSHPANVHFVEGGFPNEFEMIDFQLHVYNRGKEVATNISSKRVELTSDEAFEYIKMEYEGAHKGETLGPVPAMGTLPVDLPALLAEGKYRGPVYVRVSKDGLAEDAYLDPACERNAGDPYLSSVVRGIRFKPALSNGKAVEGVTSINLRQLTI